jgi:hypothetical protein
MGTRRRRMRASGPPSRATVMNDMWWHYKKYRGSHGWKQPAHDYFNDNFGNRVAEVMAEDPTHWDKEKDTVRKLLHLACRISVYRVEIMNKKSKLTAFTRNDVWFGLKAAQMAACPVIKTRLTWGMEGRWCNWLTDTPPDPDGKTMWRVRRVRRPKKRAAKKKVAKK